MNYYDMSQYIRALRQEQKITQQQMATHIGVSRATISSFENGRADDIGFKKVIRMLDYLNKELAVRDKSPFPTFEELIEAQRRES